MTTKYGVLIGSGGDDGKSGGGGSSRTPNTAPDSLDSRQYASIIDLISEGEIEGLVDGMRSVYLNNTPLQNLDGSYNFKEVEIHTRTGTQNQTYIPLASSVSDEKPVGLTVVYGVPVIRTITDVDVDEVRVTIQVPSLQNINVSNGDTTGASVQLEIAVQYAGGGYTTVISGANGTISGRTADEYRIDYQVRLTRPNPSDNVDIRVTRVTADSTSAYLTNAFAWYSYTEIILAKLSYPNSALIGLRVDAEQFSSIPSRSYLIKGVKVQIPSGVTVDAITGRIVYPANFVWNGTFAAATWTSCPAWILWDLLVSNRFGFGDHIDVSQLDKWAFYAASKYANELVDDGFNGTEPRFSCNTVIQTAEEAYKLINDLLSVFRCQGYWSSGALTIAQDRPADPAYLFTAANVVGGAFSYSGSSLKTRPNVAVVSYLDIGRYDVALGKWVDGLRDTAYEVVEDIDAIDKYGAVRTEVSSFACTSRGQANRLGRWLLYSERYAEICSFTASLDAGQQVRPGQIIAVSDPVRQSSRRAGRIAAATTTTITVDDTTVTDLSYSGGTTVSVILPDGTIESEQVSSIVGAVITTISPFSIAPNVNSVWMLETPTGPSAAQASLWRVISVQEQDGLTYTVNAIFHDPSKYAYIEDGTPLQPRDTTNLNVIPASPTNLNITDITLPGGLTTKEVQYELNGRIAVKITFSWLGPQGIKNFRVKYRFEDDNFTTVRVQGTTFDIEDVKPGAYSIQVSSISTSNTLYSEPAEATYTVQGLSAAPIDVSNLSLVAIGEGVALLTWTQSPELDVRLGGKVVIRHDPRPLVSAEWAASTQIVDAVAGSSSQKQVPLLPGTYFLKFEDFLGNRSTNATGVEVALPDYQSRMQLDLYVDLGYSDVYYNTGVLWSESTLTSPFSGTGINCVYDSTETALVLCGGDEYVDTNYVAEGYVYSSTVSPYVAADYWEPIYGIGDLAAEYYFSETLDMGDIYDVLFRRYVLIRSISSSTVFDSASGDFDSRTGLFDGETVDAINLTVYIRATSDNPSSSPSWGPWSELINASVQGRAFQLKAVLTSNSDSVNIAVETLSVIPELLRRFTANTAPTTASAIVFAHAFYDLNSINITASSMQSDYSYAITAASRTGFTVNFYQGVAPVVLPYTYTVTGYGRAV